MTNQSSARTVGREVTLARIAGASSGTRRRSRRPTTKKAHVAQSEEDEPTLFMVTASILPDVPNSDSKSTEVIDDGITTPVKYIVYM